MLFDIEEAELGDRGRSVFGADELLSECPGRPHRAEQRRVTPGVAQLNGTWKFIASSTLTGAEAVEFDDRSWSSVSVPHTWDTVDGVTKHSNSWYRTHFTTASGDANKKIYVYFEGVFQVADVFVNGVRLGQHRGGYTRFIFDASTALVTIFFAFDVDFVSTCPSKSLKMHTG